MRKTSIAVTTLAALALGACGSGQQPAAQETTADQVADKLEQAADQSDPEAAAVINKRADELRGAGTVAPPGQPGSYAQDTMQEAGAAAAETGTSAKQP
jgi:hypothetical protein